MSDTNWQSVVTELALEGHVEGGFFRRVYCSDTEVHTSNGSRPSMTSIYYLLTAEHPCGSLHINRSDIVHYFLRGGDLEYYLWCPEKKALQTVVLSAENPVLIVKGGVWKASRLLNGSFGLIAEAVTPGFDYQDMTLVGQSHIQKHCPEQSECLQPFIHTDS